MRNDPARRVCRVLRWLLFGTARVGAA